MNQKKSLAYILPIIVLLLLIILIIPNFGCSNRLSGNIRQLKQNNSYVGSYKGQSVYFKITKHTSDSLIGQYAIEHRNAVTKLYPFSSIVNGKDLPRILKKIIKSSSMRPISLYDYYTNSNRRNQLITLTKLKPEQLTTHPNLYKAEACEFSVLNDVKYGNAKGYWTSKPYKGENELKFMLESLSHTFEPKTALDLMLDLYLPESGVQKKPLIVYVHEGAFFAGDKAGKTAKDFSTRFCTKGYVVASVNYRMGFKPLPSLGFLPSSLSRTSVRAIQDVRAALRFLMHNSDKYNINKQHVYIAGASAGAIIALNVAFMEEDEKPEGAKISNSLIEPIGHIDSSSNIFTDTFKIKGLINMWGAIENTEVIDSYENIPILSFHGTDDDVVPYNHDYAYSKFGIIGELLTQKVCGSQVIHKKAISSGFQSKLIDFEGYKHSPHIDENNFFNSNYNTIIDTSTSFFSSLLKSDISIIGNMLVNINDNHSVYSINGNNANKYYWEIEGGWVIDKSPNNNKVTVQWFSKDQGKIRLHIVNELEVLSVQEQFVNIIL